MKTISATAAAKINLYLHITGKTANGYHALDSLVAFANTGDVLEVSPSDRVTLRISGTYGAALSSQDNLVMKAATALQQRFHIKEGAAISLQKQLPIGSGIGGGSADAAATLQLLTRLWKINAEPQDMQELALSLGADVPACLQSTSLYMSGIGEVIEPGPRLSGLFILLVGTGVPLLTRDVFAGYQGQFSQAMPHMRRFASNEELIRFLNSTRNDLQDAAIALMPEIATILQALSTEKDCLLSRMSGSGSTCFGLFAKRKYAEDAAIRLNRQYPGWWIRVAGLL
ncbi:MAG TPA: 4-(cytidine 5'-diphospho)-2-C-methyl-D-erythritol kinase [Rickettsiales bacterium]|nr:4-(cytidine 5'-diphospho)-2-C-methyl-D-erythritol kinase [Rickettsiales bacterium]